jgi:hypothetical protein
MSLSGQGQWVPRSEADLAEAVSQGLLEETHYLELKREIPAGKSANRELARDLASLAVDGGTLIVGVAEDETGARSLAPQPLDGLPERIEAVARSATDPPLAVLCTPLRSSEDQSLGYVVIRVPPSAGAPHMVDNKYLGRGDKAKIYLSDSEVRRLHEQRRATEQHGLALLRGQFARDPVSGADRRQAHLFLLAQPAVPRPQMLLDLVYGERAAANLLAFARRAETPELRRTLPSAGDFSPPLVYASDFACRRGAHLRACQRPVVAARWRPVPGRRRGA